MITTTNTRTGFTLIEMLVVVAVIGILSSVLLTGLGPARDKARDSRIMTEVNQARSIAATLDNSGFAALPVIDSFSDVDDTFKESYPELAALAIDIYGQGGDLHIIKSGAPYFRAYLIYSKLNIQAGTPPNVETNYYCVDSIGRVGFFTGLPDRLTGDPADPESVRCPLSF
ncbi:MAG: type II secretion system protein [bacterium]|nr:type II secretion system protein [bacterium]